ncbi:unnamed protein product [Trichogramma brassicae]|uniref:Uncharacterized protein n=1 Tax=Trichogramma brassicae TaxID=86971 RepID=A0A6H5J8H0_9HYME|nr:unnamed protein product [Trichogramma brassicae]
MTHWNACATPDSEYSGSGSRSTLIQSWNARGQALKIENGRERMPPHNVRERIAVHVYSLKTAAAKVSSVRRSPRCEFALACSSDDAVYDDDIQCAYTHSNCIMPSTIIHTRRTYNVSRVGIIIHDFCFVYTYTCVYESTKFSFIRSTRIFCASFYSSPHWSRSNCASLHDWSESRVGRSLYKLLRRSGIHSSTSSSRCTWLCIQIDSTTTTVAAASRDLVFMRYIAAAAASWDPQARRKLVVRRRLYE